MTRAAPSSCSCGMSAAYRTKVSPAGPQASRAVRSKRSMKLCKPALKSDAAVHVTTFVPQKVDPRRLAGSPMRRLILMILMTMLACPAAVYQPDDQGPVAPSAVAISGQIDLPDGSKGDFPVPRALRTEEMPDIVQQFVTGARNALAAGFDGVEVSTHPSCGAPVIADSFGAVCQLRSSDMCAWCRVHCTRT